MPLAPRSPRRLLTVAGTAVATLVAGLAFGSPAHASTIVTPGDFTGYGFDQCVAPTQSAMDAWLTSSPFWAVGIYISGDSRACTQQPNLTPTWIDTQLVNGWRLLPITLGPQAWCTTRERYLHQVRISPDPARRYGKARTQGRAEALKTVTRAGELGIGPGSTLWYDIEAFDIRPTDCRESALSFLSAWTNRLHALGYVSGVYSSAGSGVKMLDDAQATRPGVYAMPDQLWVARWSGVPGQINDRSATYLRDSSWTPHKRVHQYRGGHNETHGGVTINIDSNFVDLGNGSAARRTRTLCGGVAVDFTSYPTLRRGAQGSLVTAGQCLLSRAGVYAGETTGQYDDATAEAAKAYRTQLGLPARGSLSRAAWTALLSRGKQPLMKYGSSSQAVRRLQRALNAADGAALETTGVFENTTTAAVMRYQRDHGLPATGVVTDDVWNLLRAGTR